MEVIILDNLRAVCQCIADYQQSSFTHFVTYNKSPEFDNEDLVPDVCRGRLHYWSHCGKVGLPIEYDGVPFSHVGRWSLVCHQGKDKSLRRKLKLSDERKKLLDSTGAMKASRKSSTKKVNCPAEIYVSHIVKYPQFKVPSNLLEENSLPTEQVRRVIKRKLLTAYKRSASKLAAVHYFYIKLPLPQDHQGHPLVSRLVDKFATRTKDVVFNSSTLDRRKVNKNRDRQRRTREPIDERVAAKLQELARSGLDSTVLIRAELNKYVINELFVGQQPPPAMFRRYNPTSRDIINALHRAKQEATAAHLHALRSHCRSSLASISGSLEDIEDEETLSETLRQLQSIAQGLSPNTPERDTSCSVSVHHMPPEEEDDVTAAATITVYEDRECVETYMDHVKREEAEICE